MQRILIYTLLIVSLSSGSLMAKADSLPSNSGLSYNFEASIGQSNLNRDFAFSAFDYQFELGFPAGQILSPTIVRINKIDELIVLPNNDLVQTSLVYNIDIPAEVFRTQGVYYLSLISSQSNYYKQVYYFDITKNSWQPMPTTENFNKKILSAVLKWPSIRLVVLENKKTLVKGKASWYKYKNGLFAASPDFPKGTKLRVINLDNKKSVDVVVNDYGPDRIKHPERSIDLDAVAFARLAPLGQGTINVAVEKLADDTPVLNAPIKTEDIKLSAKNALVFNSADKKIIWSKNDEAVIPLASLTKLVALKVFLETKPDFKKIVTYSIKDEQLNNNYVLANQSARLKLKDGDKVTIKDLFYSSLIGSTNNTVESLVRLSGLKREAFIAKMNQRVKDWGATKTKFIEPTGLSVKDVTTARDYVIIAREVFLDKIISTVSTQASYSLTTINSKIKHSFKNTNLLARESKSGLLGSKTGYLDEAGYCLVTKWPTDKKKNVIIALFGAPSRQASVDDTKALLNFATKNIN